jgi:hypothetical protein
MNKVKIFVALQKDSFQISANTTVLLPDGTNLPVNHSVSRGASRTAGKPASGSLISRTNATYGDGSSSFDEQWRTVRNCGE